MPSEIPPAPPGALVTRDILELATQRAPGETERVLCREVARCWALLAPRPCGHPAAYETTNGYCPLCAAVESSRNASSACERASAVVKAARAITRSGVQIKDTDGLDWVSPQVDRAEWIELCAAVDQLDAQEVNGVRAPSKMDTSLGRVDSDREKSK